MEFKLLVVDDERPVVEAITETFQGKGYKILKAASGDEAISILKRQTVDLVILDLAMAGLSGEEVLKHLKSTASTAKAVIVTAYPEREPAARALGCEAFLHKPLKMEELVSCVDRLLDQKDEEELRSVTMGFKAETALPGEPVAHLLLFEPSDVLAERLLRFLTRRATARGIYTVDLAATLDQALTLMITTHPDLILLDLKTIRAPQETIRGLTACKFQPKDYIPYLDSDNSGQQPLLDSSWPRWRGSPWSEDDLGQLAKLLQATTLKHGLVKR